MSAGWVGDPSLCLCQTPADATCNNETLPKGFPQMVIGNWISEYSGLPQTTCKDFTAAPGQDRTNTDALRLRRRRRALSEMPCHVSHLPSRSRQLACQEPGVRGRLCDRELSKQNTSDIRRSGPGPWPCGAACWGETWPSFLRRTVPLAERRRADATEVLVVTSRAGVGCICGFHDVWLRCRCFV